MTGDPYNMQMWISDRLRHIESDLTDLRDRSVEERITDRQHRNEIKTALASISAISSDVSKMSAVVSETHEMLQLVTQWSRRIALAIGLVLLMSQHLTVSQMARVAKVVMGW